MKEVSNSRSNSSKEYPFSFGFKKWGSSKMVQSNETFTFCAYTKLYIGISSLITPSVSALDILELLVEDEFWQYHEENNFLRPAWGSGAPW